MIERPRRLTLHQNMRTDIEEAANETSFATVLPCTIGCCSLDACGGRMPTYRSAFDLMDPSSRTGSLITGQWTPLLYTVRPHRFCAGDHYAKGKSITDDR
jgi:hypothetical protein